MYVQIAVKIDDALTTNVGSVTDTCTSGRHQCPNTHPPCCEQGEQFMPVDQMHTQRRKSKLHVCQNCYAKRYAQVKGFWSILLRESPAGNVTRLFVAGAAKHLVTR